MPNRTAQAVLPRGQRRSGGGAGGLSFCPAAGQFSRPRVLALTQSKRSPAEAGPVGSPTKEPSGAIGHPFVEFGFLIGRQAHQLLCRGIAHELFHLLGFFCFLQLGETSDTLVAGVTVNKIAK